VVRTWDEKLMFYLFSFLDKCMESPFYARSLVKPVFGNITGNVHPCIARRLVCRDIVDNFPQETLNSELKAKLFSE